MKKSGCPCRFFLCQKICWMTRANLWITILLLFLGFQFGAYGQYFNQGQEPSRIRWSKVSTLHFDVVFPEGFDVEGKRVANLMEKAYRPVGGSLNHFPKKVPVLLHPQTVKSNAFLGWSPSRIEMYATPHQNTYAQDWLEQLAIHEFRHMVQVGKIEAEMPRVLRFLSGEHAAAAITAVHLPYWLIEGDAVCAETALSHSGRGRQPDFHKESKALLAENVRYGYDKAYLGSFKDYVPNHYRMGYLLTSGTRLLFEKVVWDDVLHQIAKKPYSINALDKGLKKSIGLNKIQLYDSVFSHLQLMWQHELANSTPIDYQKINKTNKYYTSYTFGAFTSKGDYFAKRSKLDDVNRFVLISPDGREKILFTPGSHFDESVSASDSFVVWSERLPHIRWQHADRSMICLLNINTGKIARYRTDQKWFAPKLSPDHSKIVVSEADNLYRFRLKILDAATFETLWQYEPDENSYFIHPNWSADGKSIIAVVLRNNQKAIVAIDTEQKKETILLPFAVQEISNPLPYHNSILFIGGYTGTDNLYEVNQETGEVFQLTQSGYGISHPSVSDNSILFSDYTINGYKLVEALYDSLTRQKVDLNNHQVVYPLADALTKQEAGIIEFDSLQSFDYQTMPYPKVLNQLKFHSWAPLFIDPYKYTVAPGVSMVSQNLLSTTEALVGYQYSLEDRAGEVLAKLKYMGLFPIVEAETRYGKKKSYYNQLNIVRNADGQIIRADTLRKDFAWNQTSLNASVYLPFDFSRGRYYKKVQPQVDYQYTKIDLLKEIPSSVMPDGAYRIFGTSLYMYLIERSSHQDLLPNFGIISELNYVQSLKGSVDFGSRYSLVAMAYVPGAKANHGIKLYSGFQQKTRGSYGLGDRIRLARGHQRALNDRMFTVSADYLFPFWYPDLAIGRFVYFKRFKAALFYDHSWLSGMQLSNGQMQGYQYALRSCGTELTSDLHLFRFIAPIETGIRIGYLFEKQMRYDFLFNIRFSF